MHRIELSRRHAVAGLIALMTAGCDGGGAGSVVVAAPTAATPPAVPPPAAARPGTDVLPGWKAGYIDLLFDQRGTPASAPFGWHATGPAATYDPATETLTLPGTAGAAHADLIFPSSRDCLVLESWVTLSPGHAVDVAICADEVPLLTVSIDAAADAVTLSDGETDPVTALPPYLDADDPAGFYLILCIKPVERKAFVALRYRNALAATGLDAQRTFFGDDFAWPDGAANRLRIAPRETGGADAAIGLRYTGLFRPSTILTGDSIVAGSNQDGDFWTPYPGYDGGETLNREADLAWLLGKARSTRMLNFAVASGGLAGVEGLNAALQRFGPTTMISNFGATNMLNVVGVNKATLDDLVARAGALVDDWRAAGIRVCALDCLPRVWRSAQGMIAGLATDFNQAEADWVAAKGAIHVALYDAFVLHGNRPNTALMTDSTHPNLQGKQLMADLILAALPSR